MVKGHLFSVDDMGSPYVDRVWLVWPVQVYEVPHSVGQKSNLGGQGDQDTALTPGSSKVRYDPAYPYYLWKQFTPT